MHQKKDSKDEQKSNKDSKKKENKLNIDDLTAENELLKGKLEEYLNGWRRAKADYENLQRQTGQEKESFTKFANMNLLMSFIPVYQNMKLSFDHLPAELVDNNWVTGVGFIKNEFQKALEQNGVEEINPQVGDHFDPEQHESVDKSDAHEDGLVKEVKSVGFKLNGKVFIPAKVII